MMIWVFLICELVAGKCIIEFLKDKNFSLSLMNFLKKICLFLKRKVSRNITQPLEIRGIRYWPACCISLQWSVSKIKILKRTPTQNQVGSLEFIRILLYYRALQWDELERKYNKTQRYLKQTEGGGVIFIPMPKVA